ncbi:hypothetical protein LR48_Vigan11g119600 [Vigna angularis]|uniref:Ubiquitin-like protease family profile domain-containing protein n=1 Tax=Phaseolus angularis TaxID=3914 RepID=A0A0L9VTI0_PHAAN|nr:hypothetical protein LR48_Vigan11g119600 [Vigna angularis]
MTQGHMGADETPTAPRVSTRGSCSAVEPNEYSGQYELLVDGDPPRIVAVARVLKGGETIHGVAILPQHVRVTIDEVRDPQAQVIEGDRMLNISIIQLWCMYMDTIVVDQGRSSMYEFVEPQTIQPSGNTLQNRQHYLQTWMDESKRDIYLVPYIDGVIGKSRGQLCNQQVDSWECGFYVMCWIKTIIRPVITDDWNEGSPTPKKTHLSKDDPLGTLEELYNIITDALIIVPLDSTTFGRHYEISLYLHQQDIKEIASGREEINISLVLLWMMYMFGVSNKMGFNDLYGFIDPQMTHEGNKFDDIQEYVISCFAMGKELYFLPYILG